MKPQKSNIVQPGSAIFVSITVQEKRNLTIILKIVQVSSVMSIISILNIC